MFEVDLLIRVATARLDGDLDSLLEMSRIKGCPTGGVPSGVDEFMPVFLLALEVQVSKGVI